MKWKKTLLISFGILILIIGGISIYAKMSNQSMLELLPFTLKGIMSNAGEGSLSKEDYYKISNVKSTGSYEFTLKNPDNKDLNFSELKEKTKEGERSPLDFEITILEGGISSDKFYEIQNVSEPVYINVENGTRIENFIDVIDVNKTHIELKTFNFEGTENYFLNKKDVVEYDVLEKTVELIKYMKIQNGTELVERKVEFKLKDIEKISLDKGMERKIIREIKPKMSSLPDGTWGYSIYTNPWFNTSFDKRRNITLNNLESSENLTDFPVLIVLNSSRIDYSLTLDDGSDIRFVDDDESTLLSYEIAVWNETGNSYVWVKVPQIDDGSTIDFIQMYYSNQTNVDDGQDVNGVWNSDFSTVWHLDKNSTGDVNTLDSTSNNNDGANTGTVVSVGEVSDGANFDSTDTIALSNAQFIDGGSFSISWWEKINSDSSFKGRFILTYDSKIFIVARGVFPYNAIMFGPNGGTMLKSTTAPTIADSVGEWHHFFLIGSDSSSRTASDYNLFVDGINLSIETDSTYNSGAGTRGVGYNIALGSSADSVMDEIRIMNASQSDSWAYAEFLSQNDSFATFGSEETAPPDGDTFPQWSNNLTNSTIAGTLVLHSVEWTDDIGLSGYIFEFDNGTGTFANDSFVTFTGTSNESNITKIINATVGTTIQWRVYANDSLDQLNSTDLFSYTTTALTCWSYNSGTKLRIIPTGCIYEQSFGTIGET